MNLLKAKGSLQDMVTYSGNALELTVCQSFVQEPVKIKDRDGPVVHFFQGQGQQYHVSQLQIPLSHRNHCSVCETGLEFLGVVCRYKAISLRLFRTRPYSTQTNIAPTTKLSTCVHHTPRTVRPQRRL